MYEGFGIFEFVLDIILNKTIDMNNFDNEKWQQLFESFLYFVISGYSVNKAQRMKEMVLTIKKIYKKYELKEKIHSTSLIHDIIQGRFGFKDENEVITMIHIHLMDKDIENV